jgi:hypothetical protein
MIEFKLNENLTKVKDNLAKSTVLFIGALVSVLIWTVFIVEIEIVKKSNNETCHPLIEYPNRVGRILTLKNYTALYVYEGANVILMDNRPRYNALHLNGEQLVTLTNFTHKCILCDHFDECPYKTSPVRLPANSINTLLTLPYFDHCHLPTQCYLLGRKFNCKDLVTLTKLTT